MKRKQFQIVPSERFGAIRLQLHSKEPVLSRIVLGVVGNWCLSWFWTCAFIDSCFLCLRFGLGRFAQPRAGFAERGEDRLANRGKGLRVDCSFGWIFVRTQITRSGRI